MTELEAWTITGLGIAVVFIGLLLCIAFIQVFNRIARNVSWGAHGHGGVHQAAAALAPEAASSGPAPAPASVQAVDAEVVAVIAAVVEVERALYLPGFDSRLTIRRPAVFPGA